MPSFPHLLSCTCFRASHTRLTAQNAADIVDQKMQFDARLGKAEADAAELKAAEMKVRRGRVLNNCLAQPCNLPGYVTPRCSPDLGEHRADRGSLA